jgi:hypothetical protein
MISGHVHLGQNEWQGEEMRFIATNNHSVSLIAQLNSSKNPSCLNRTV